MGTAASDSVKCVLVACKAGPVMLHTIMLVLDTDCLSQVVMSILALVRNYIPAHYQVVNGEWDIARIAAKCAATLARHACPASKSNTCVAACTMCTLM